MVLLDDFVADVLVCLDRNDCSVALLADDADALLLRDVVRSKVCEAVERVHCIAPVHLLGGGVSFGDDVMWMDDVTDWDFMSGCGVVRLPDDFMRLVAFKMSDWARACHSAIDVSDSRYALQRSRHAGLRGTWESPVCAIAPRSEYRVLEFYGCKDDEAVVEYGLYLPYPKVTKVGGSDMVDVCERCYRSAVYMAASLSLVSMGEADKASALAGLSRSYLGLE